MPIRLGHFYASLLLLGCLGVNIAFFPEVREPFLGGEDPLASVKAALSDLSIKAKFDEIRPKIASEVGDESDVLPSSEPLPKPIKPLAPTKKPLKVSLKVESDKTSASQSKPMQKESITDPFLLPAQSPKEPTHQIDPKDFELKQFEKIRPAEPKKESGANRQPVAVVSIPQPVAAQPVVTDQFKPIVTPPKPIESAAPSIESIWDTIDTVLERPLRYD